MKKLFLIALMVTTVASMFAGRCGGCGCGCGCCHRDVEVSEVL